MIRMHAYNFTARTFPTGAHLSRLASGHVSAPSKLLAKLAIIDYSGHTLCSIQIGGVKRTPVESVYFCNLA